MRKLLLKILPVGVIDLYKRYKKKRRAKQRTILEQNKEIVQKEDIERVLADLGIKRGGVVMLHSSLSSIGLVDGGAEAVVLAFLNVLSAGGTLVMPAFPAMGFNLDYLKSDPVFDIRNTPSRMGSITETFRKMKDVKRSFHPTDSVCALGKEAEWITSSHFGQLTPYNRESPFFKLCALNAKIVLLGVDFNSLTNLHTLEDAVADFKFPVYYSEIFECRMVDWNGHANTMKTKVHDPKFSRQRKCNELITQFAKAGFLRKGKIGKAEVMIIEATAMHEWMLKNYYEKGITMYTPNGSS